MNLEPKIFFTKGTYAITINPDDKRQYIGPQRMIKFRNYINAQVLHLPQKGITYNLYIEISEQLDYKKFTCSNEKSKFPRLHLHGTITFHSKASIKYLLLYFLPQISTWSKYKINTINDINIWDKYCKKQQHIVNEEPITNTYVKTNRGHTAEKLLLFEEM